MPAYTAARMSERDGRARALHRVGLWTLIAVWLACAGLTLAELRRPQGFPPFRLAFPETADAYPVFVGTGSLAVDPPGSGPRAGDRLARIGDVDPRGLGRSAFLALWFREDRPAGSWLSLSFLRDGELRVTRAHLPSNHAFVTFQLLVVLFGAMGIVVGARAPGSRLGRACFLWAVFWSLSYLHFPGDSAGQVTAWGAINLLATFATWPLYLRVALLTPEETAPRKAWPFHATWLALVVGIVRALPALWPSLLPPTASIGLVFGLYAVFNVIFLSILVRNYLRASAPGRRQVRWILWAWGVVLPCYVAAQLITVTDTDRLNAVLPLYLTGALVPLAYVVAILRSNLFDIDRVISASAAYGLIVFVLVGAGLAGVPRAANALAHTLSIDAQTTQLGLAFVLAAAVVPAQRALRPFVDRVFHKERAALERGIEGLLAELPECEDPRELLTRVGERIEALVRPDACVIYGRSGRGFAPLFVRGRAVPTAFDAESKLVATLSERSTPLARERWTGRRAAGALDPFDRAALETLGADAIAPIRHRDRLAAFLCLGTKRSGDVYTSTDLSFLGAVARALSRELDRFDDAELLRQKEAMQEALRRFVPGAVAERLERGQDLGSGERDLSVVFVDIRGYSGYAEGRAPDDVFGTINRYTEAVSQIVRKHGGSVVEFNGDGMMAVFGAPDRIPNKERAALDAGREISTRVRDVALGLDVGVGIATGPAFVGEIRGTDRAIWSAIGNTTNLAARLQALTRELDAAIAIDTATRAAVGDAGSDFERHERVPIRGRSGPVDVHVLPRRV